MNYLARRIEPSLKEAIARSPVTVLLGPRQVGKTTLLKKLLAELPKPAHYLDLELPSDARKLVDAEIYFSQFADQTIVVDEVQRMPALFPLIRALVDQRREPGRFILLGSASPELLLKSAESLAGRVEYHYLTPFLLTETGLSEQMKLWFRGGFPTAFFAENDLAAQRWLDRFIQTYVERDLPLLGMGAAPITALNLLRMIASVQGQSLNMSAFSSILGISGATTGKFLDVLEHAFLIRRLQPFHSKMARRIVKAPKIYIRDSGILHTLNEVESPSKLVGQLAVGHSWEGFVIEQILASVGRRLNPYFYRTADGNELDLILAKGIEPVATIEIKYSNSPNLTRGYWLAIEDVKAPHHFVVTPGSDNYKIQQEVEVISLMDLLKKLSQL